MLYLVLSEEGRTVDAKTILTSFDPEVRKFVVTLRVRKADSSLNEVGIELERELSDRSRLISPTKEPI